MLMMLAGLPGKMKTLLDRLTAARAGNLDRLDATVSSRAPANTALLRAVWSDARAAALDEITPQRMENLNAVGVKSVQRGKVGFGDTATSILVTISAVVPGKSVLIFSHTTNTSLPDVGEMFRQTFVAGHLLSATQLEFTKSMEGGGPTVAWQLIEYN